MRSPIFPSTIRLFRELETGVLFLYRGTDGGLLLNDHLAVDPALGLLVAEDELTARFVAARYKRRRKDVLTAFKAKKFLPTYCKWAEKSGAVGVWLATIRRGVLRMRLVMWAEIETEILAATAGIA